MYVGGIYMCTLRGIYMHCPKLRVHPAPGAHISMAGCTIFGGVFIIGC